MSSNLRHGAWSEVWRWTESCMPHGRFRFSILPGLSFPMQIRREMPFQVELPEQIVLWLEQIVLLILIKDWKMEVCHSPNSCLVMRSIHFLSFLMMLLFIFIINLLIFLLLRDILAKSFKLLFNIFHWLFALWINIRLIVPKALSKCVTNSFIRNCQSKSTQGWAIWCRHSRLPRAHR